MRRMTEAHTPPSAAATARHDLATPLSGVIGYAGIVQEDAADLGLTEAAVSARGIADRARTIAASIRSTLAGDADAAQLPPLLAAVQACCAAPARELAEETAALRASVEAAGAEEMLHDLDQIAACVAALERALAAHAPPA
jgi:signal transduction histidine kinase